MIISIICKAVTARTADVKGIGAEAGRDLQKTSRLGERNNICSTVAAVTCETTIRTDQMRGAILGKKISNAIDYQAAHSM